MRGNTRALMSSPFCSNLECLVFELEQLVSLRILVNPLSLLAHLRAHHEDHRSGQREDFRTP